MNLLHTVDDAPPEVRNGLRRDVPGMAWPGEVCRLQAELVECNLLARSGLLAEAAEVDVVVAGVALDASGCILETLPEPGRGLRRILRLMPEQDRVRHQVQHQG